jgi:hypothetical protein
MDWLRDPRFLISAKTKPSGDAEGLKCLRRLGRLGMLGLRISREADEADEADEARREYGIWR